MAPDLALLLSFLEFFEVIGLFQALFLFVRLFHFLGQAVVLAGLLEQLPQLGNHLRHLGVAFLFQSGQLFHLAVHHCRAVFIGVLPGHILIDGRLHDTLQLGHIGGLPDELPDCVGAVVGADVLGAVLLSGVVSSSGGAETAVSPSRSFLAASSADREPSTRALISSGEKV